MSRDAADASAESDATVTRRGALKAFAGTGVLAGAGKAVDNVLLGYGEVVGTNLVEQDLETLVDRRFGPRTTSLRVGDRTLALRDGRIEVADADGRALVAIDAADTSPERAAEIDEEHDLEGGPLEQLVADLRAIRDGEYSFEFSRSPAFFDRVDAADARPFTVGAVRGPAFDGVAPETIREFAGVDPANVESLVEGIASGFREHTGYDTPQYVAGSIQDNVLFDAVDLRAYFRSPTSYDAILSGAVSGLFCYHFTYRSIEAFHAVAPHRQSVAVAGAVVTDARHKHVYTGLASVVREGGDLVVPMTFVDYMHSTQYDDFRLRGVLGEGIEAYDRRHRTDGVYWNRYARW